MCSGPSGLMPCPVCRAPSKFHRVPDSRARWPSAPSSGHCRALLALFELAGPLFRAAVLIVARTPDRALALHRKASTIPMLAWGVELDNLVCQKRITVVEVVLAKRGDTSAHSLYRQRTSTP